MDLHLLSNTDDIDKLLKQADALNIDVRVGDDGKIKTHKLQKSAETVKWDQQFEKAINQNKKLVEFAITKKGWPGVFNPESPLNDVLPDTGAGKGAMAGLMGLDALAPEVGLPLQLLMRLGAGIGGGIAGGAATGQPMGDSAQTGAVSAATDMGLRGIFKGAKTAKNYLTRPGRLDREMMGNVGKVVADYLHDVIPNNVGRIATHADELGQPGKNTVVRVLTSPEANKELEKGYDDATKVVIKEIVEDARNDTANLAKNFKAKYGFSPTKTPPNTPQVNEQMWKDIAQFKEAQADARVIGNQTRNAFKEIALLGRGSYDTDGELKHSYSAFKNVQTKTQLNDKLSELMQKADPSGGLHTVLQNARDGYAKFKGFQDFVTTENVMDKKGQWFNAQTIQKAVDGQTNPAVRFIQNRIKEAFEPLYQAVRRGAQPFSEKGTPQISDNPLFGGNVRAASSIPLVGRVAAGIPTPRALGHFIPPKAGLTPQTAGELPVLLNSLVTKMTETPDKQSQ